MREKDIFTAQYVGSRLAFAQGLDIAVFRVKNIFTAQSNKRHRKSVPFVISVYHTTEVKTIRSETEHLPVPA